MGRLLTAPSVIINFDKVCGSAQLDFIKVVKFWQPTGNFETNFRQNKRVSLGLVERNRAAGFEPVTMGIFSKSS